MPETVPERHYLDRVQSVRELARRLQPDPAAISWQDYEDLVGLCLELSASAQDLMEKEYRRIFRDANLTVGWLRERRQVLEKLSDSYVQLVASLRPCVPRAEKTAGSRPGEDLVVLLDNGIKAVVEAKQDVLSRWPVAGPEETAAVKAAIVRGETVDADEAFAEIAGTDVDTWRKNVEEYQRRRERPAGK
jgi:hypothetical protein